MNPLVSVVIPVYNVEKYLRQCLDSVINQTYKNLEIICINDCTTDSSDKILEEYAKKDSRIIVKKNSENLGLGLSRNEGIKIAKGEFIHCLDSDDWMELNAYETILKYFDKDVDAVRFTYLSHNQTNGKVEHINSPQKDLLYKKVNIYDNPECFKLWWSSAWIKVYRKNFIIENSLFYNDYRCLEDIEYAIRTALKAKNIVFIDEALLNYRAERKGSLLTKRAAYIENVLQDTIWANSIAKQLPQKTAGAILNYIYQLFVMNALDAYYFNKLSYNKMKLLFARNVDLNVFQYNEIFDAQLAYKYCKKVLEYNHLKFFFSYNLRRYIKEHFPELTKYYFEIKRRILNAD